MFGKEITISSMIGHYHYGLQHSPVGPSLLAVSSGDSTGDYDINCIKIYVRNGNQYNNIYWSNSLADKYTIRASLGSVDENTDLIPYYGKQESPAKTLCGILKRSNNTVVSAAVPANIASMASSLSLKYFGISLDASVLVAVESQLLTENYIIHVYLRSGDSFNEVGSSMLSFSGYYYTSLSSAKVSSSGDYFGLTFSNSPTQSTIERRVILMQKTGNSFSKIYETTNVQSGAGSEFFFSPDDTQVGIDYMGLYRLPSVEQVQDPTITTGMIAMGWEKSQILRAHQNRGDTNGIRVYEISDGVAGKNIPFPTSTGYIYDNIVFSENSEIIIASISASTGLRGWIIDSDAIPDTPTLISPNNSFVQVDEPSIFIWKHNISTGTAQTKAEIAYKEDSTSDWIYITIDGAANSYEFPANTFVSGKTYNWSARTYNQYNEAGEWATSTLFTGVGPPPPPTIGAIANSSRPAISWESESQAGYEVTIQNGDGDTIWTTGERAGAQTAVQPDIFLPNGTYVVYVRTISSSREWSSWAEKEFTINVIGPEAPVLSAEAENEYIHLSWTSPEDVTLYLLRDNIPIANVTGLSSYDDYTAIGTQRYTLRAVDVSQNYTDSNTVLCVLNLDSPLLATVDDLSSPMRLYLTRGAPRALNITTGNMLSYQYFAGRKYPVAIGQNQLTKNFSIMFSFMQADFGRIPLLMTMLNSGQTLLYRDTWGNRFWCVAMDVSMNQEAAGVDITPTFQEVDYVEEIHYE